MVVPNMLVICRHFSIRTNENPVPEFDPFKCRRKRICYTEVLHINKSPPWFQIPDCVIHQKVVIYRRASP